jgi:hypothetical protein
MGSCHRPPVHAPHLAHADDVPRGRYRNPSELGFEHTGVAVLTVLRARGSARLHIPFVADEGDQLTVVPRDVVARLREHATRVVASGHRRRD